MQIKEVTAGVKLSQDYNSYSCSITAELDQGEEADIAGISLMGKAMDIVQKKTGIMSTKENTEKKVETKETTAKPEQCEKCNIPITEKVIRYSQKNFKKNLCFECQKLEGKN